jgi:hypothetical protein
LETTCPAFSAACVAIWATVVKNSTFQIAISISLRRSLTCPAHSAGVCTVYASVLSRSAEVACDLFRKETTMSTTMHRLQISLPQWEMQFLEERARRDGLSIAEVIRQLIEREANTAHASADSIWEFVGKFEDKQPLIDGIPVSEAVDLYITEHKLRDHKVLRERPRTASRRRKTKK